MSYMDFSRIIEPIGYAIFTVTYAVALNWALSIKKRRRKEEQTSMFQTVSTGLANGTVTAYEDVVNVYKGIRRLSADDLSYRAGLASFLRELLVEIVSGKIGEQHKDLVALKEQVTGFLRQAEEEAPFADLPDVERSLISDLVKFAEINDKESLTRKLDELASSIQVRVQEHARSEKLNKWSIPLAVAGLVLTILFGIASLK
jgi:hypothetical protein